MTVKNAPDVYEVRNRWLGDDVWMLDEDYQEELVARFNQFIANVKAEALEELADHFATPQVVRQGDRGVFVYNSAEHADTPRSRPKRLTDFMRARAAEYRSGART